MKKLFGLILSALVVSMFFQSCIDDKLEDTSSSSTLNEGKCYMSIQFNVKSSHGDGMSTRTFQPTYKDEDFERTISDFRIFLVKTSDSDAEVVELKDFEMSDKHTTKPFLISPAYMHGYQLYVVANSAGSGLTLNLNSAKAFRGTYSLATKEACANVWRRDHFLMVNANNEASDFDDYKYVYVRNGDDYYLEHTDPTPNGGVPIEMDDNKDYTYDNPYKVDVNLERVAAKIVVNCDKESFDFSGSTYGGKFTDVHVDGVSLINASNCFNLVQQWKIACYEGAKAFAYNWLKVKNNYSADAPFGYPYLWPITPTGDINSIPSNIYYSQIGNFTNFDEEALREGADSYFDALEKDKSVTYYCLENASPLYLDFMENFDKSTDLVRKDESFAQKAIKTAMRNRATGVLFRVRAKFQDDSNTTDDLIVDPEDGKWTNQARLSRSDDEYKTLYCYNSFVTSRLSVLLRDYPELAKNGITSSSTVKELRKAGVKVFEDGYMYYMHWIQDQNYKYIWSWELDDPDEEYPFYYCAVLRNTRYEVTVSEVKEIGMDLPGRETIPQYYNRFDLIEGNDYLLYPISIKDAGSYNWFKKDYLEKLKNKNI